eukprot:gene35449-37575_t
MRRSALPALPVMLALLPTAGMATAGDAGFHTPLVTGVTAVDVRVRTCTARPADWDGGDACITVACAAPQLGEVGIVAQMTRSSSGMAPRVTTMREGRWGSQPTRELLYTSGGDVPQGHLIPRPVALHWRVSPGRVLNVVPARMVPGSLLHGARLPAGHAAYLSSDVDDAALSREWYGDGFNTSASGPPSGTEGSPQEQLRADDPGAGADAASRRAHTLGYHKWYGDDDCGLEIMMGIAVDYSLFSTPDTDKKGGWNGDTGLAMSEVSRIVSTTNKNFVAQMNMRIIISDVVIALSAGPGACTPQC